MTTKPKPVTLFGRRMRHNAEAGAVRGQNFRLGNAYIDGDSAGLWNGCYFQHQAIELRVGWHSTPHAAARALERKIEAQWKRLGKLMGKEGKK